MTTPPGTAHQVSTVETDYCSSSVRAPVAEGINDPCSGEAQPYRNTVWRTDFYNWVRVTDWRHRLEEETRICLGFGGKVRLHTWTFKRQPRGTADARTIGKAHVRLIKRAYRQGFKDEIALCKEVDSGLVTSDFGRSLSTHGIRMLWRPPYQRELRVAWVCERGSKTGRLHLHALIYEPWGLARNDWRLPAYRWVHGHQDQRSVALGSKGKRESGYIAKYLCKQDGRIGCSSNFGLTTVTTFGSSSSLRILALSHPRLLQTLWQRLSLTKSWRTSQGFNSLIWRDRSSTTTQRQTSRLRCHLRMIGGNDLLEENRWTVSSEYGSLDATAGEDLPPRASRAVGRKAAKRLVHELWEAYASARSLGDWRAEREIRVLFPGLADFAGRALFRAPACTEDAAAAYKSARGASRASRRKKRPVSITRCPRSAADLAIVGRLVKERACWIRWDLRPLPAARGKETDDQALPNPQDKIPRGPSQKA